MDKLKTLRKLMKSKGIDIWMIFLSDYHGSETVSAHFGEIEYISGFTGTNATIVVTDNEAGLWTDGRYFIQAKKQIAQSGVELFEMGSKGVPTVEEFVEDHLKPRSVLGYDGRMICAHDHLQYKKMVKKKRGRVITGINLVDEMWHDRSDIPSGSVWILKKKYAGLSVSKKIEKTRKIIAKKGADATVISSLYDIAWLLNLRGSDIDCVPVFMSYLYLSNKRCTLFINPSVLSPQVWSHLKKNHIDVRRYEKVYDYLKTIKAKKIVVDPFSVNASLVDSLPRKAKVIKAKMPTEALKAKKNKTEIRNTKAAHIKDGVAVTKFIYYIKQNIGVKTLTEMGAADYLHSLRAAQKHFLGESFPTISAYGANAAMMHYEPSRENDVILSPKGFLLVDSGGHYLEGTTDITRTITLGELTPEEIHGYTLTLRAHLRLMAAKFPKGVICQNLDALSRGVFWDEGLDYRCGTGHGVGHILNVHEGPNGFRWRITDSLPACELQPGMITTDEPGLYEEGKFGVRIENELLCVKLEETEYGQFMGFDCITVAPIDLDAVDVSLLTDYEKKTLNDYHRFVYKTLSPYLEEDERVWLKQATREI